MRKFNKKIIIPLIIMLLIPSIQIKAAEGISNNKQYKKISAKKIPITYSGIDEEYIAPEVEKKLEKINEATVLEKMTEDQYEVAIAYSSGNYEFVESTMDYNYAVEKADNIGNPKSQKVGVVINKDGNVVYSPSGVARVRKYIGGSLDNTAKNNSNVFTTAALSRAHTYINHKYVDDVALIDQSGTSVKIQVASYTGWMQGDNSTGNYDISIIPLNQYTNPSYYYSEGGILYHFISNDAAGSVGSGNIISRGPAPEYLKQGKKYLSFDGVYFYEITTIQEAYITLTADLRAGRPGYYAVNWDKPYYNYYNYLPFRTKSTYTAEQLNKFIDNNTVNRPNSKLKGIGQVLKESEDKYGVNAILTLGVAINESGWGTSTIAQSKNNLFGIKAYDSDPTGSSTTFETPGDSVIGFTKHYISKGYSDPNDWRAYGAVLGNKEQGVNVKYASDPFWGEKASSLAFRIDYELSGKNLSKLSDHDNYQLIKITGPSNIYNENWDTYFRVGNEKVTRTGTLQKGIIVPLSSLKKLDLEGHTYYQIHPDRKDIISNVDITGDYNFGNVGLLNVVNTEKINTPKYNSTIYTREDINKDGNVDIEDLTFVASYYNVKKNDQNWNAIADINEDGIVDIFDLVKVSIKM